MVVSSRIAQILELCSLSRNSKMGVQITELLKKKEIKLSSLSQKKIAIDAPNHLYQFLSTIRAVDGALLMDSKGRPTSHLIGLFSRTTNLLKQNIKLVYVFDGQVPELKKAELRKRRIIKEEAAEKFKEAEEKEDIESMKKYAPRSSRLTSEMIDESKKLLDALGIPCVEAPCEGEAQASYMTRKGDCLATASQDADCLLFQSPLLIRNFSITGRKKMHGKLAYQKTEPELISLKENLDGLGINQDQLIRLAMLVGTDYNNKGIKGIGPKSALKLVKKHPAPEKLFREVKWEEHFEIKWQEVFNLIKNMPVTDDYELNFSKIDKEKIVKLLVDEHDFSQERVEKNVEVLLKSKEGRTQRGLGDFV